MTASSQPKHHCRCALLCSRQLSLSKDRSVAKLAWGHNGEHVADKMLTATETIVLAPESWLPPL